MKLISWMRGKAMRFGWLRFAAMLLAMLCAVSGLGLAQAEEASPPRLPSPDAWFGNAIGRNSEQDHRLYQTVSFSFKETGERAAADAVDGYIELLQDARFGLELIDNDEGANRDMMTSETAYYFRYTGGAELEDLSEMKTFDLYTASKPPKGTAVRVRVSVIMGSIYTMYIDYVSEFELVDEGDCFKDVKYLKEYRSSGNPSFGGF